MTALRPLASTQRLAVHRQELIELAFDDGFHESLDYLFAAQIGCLTAFDQPVSLRRVQAALRFESVQPRNSACLSSGPHVSRNCSIVGQFCGSGSIVFQKAVFRPNEFRMASQKFGLLSLHFFTLRIAS
jgi:hypothetical protein